MSDQTETAQEPSREPVTAEDVRELVTHLRKSQHPMWCNSRIQLKAHDRCDCGLHQAADLLLRESLKAQAAEAEVVQVERARLEIAREAFKAGFLAVCRKAGDTTPLEILTRVWSFDGVAAADLEPEAFAAWQRAEIAEAALTPVKTDPQKES